MNQYHFRINQIIYGIHRWRILWSWPEWNLNPRPQNSVQTLYALTDWAIKPWVQHTVVQHVPYIYWYAGIQISAVTWIWILLYALRRQKALLRTKDIQHVIFQHLDVLHVPRSAHTYYIYIWLIGNFWHLTLYSRTLTSAISKYINKRWKVSWWERYFGICDQTEKTS